MEPLVYKINNYEFNKVSIALFPEDRKTVLLDENLKPKLEYQINYQI